MMKCLVLLLLSATSQTLVASAEAEAVAAAAAAGATATWPTMEAAQKAATAAAEGRRLTTAFTNDNIGTAVDAWCSDSSSAEATYGDISTWDTSGVTDMSNLFVDCCPTNDLGICCKADDCGGASNYLWDEDADEALLASWDISQVSTMERMFYNQYGAMDGCLSWDIPSSTTTTEMFSGDHGTKGIKDGKWRSQVSWSADKWACENTCTSEKVCDSDQWYSGPSNGEVCVDCPFPEGCDGSNCCQSGFIEPYCTNCDRGKFFFNEKCRTCPAWAGNAWVLGVVFGAIVAFLMYRFSGGVEDMSPFTIATAFFQVTYIYFTFELSFPDLVLEIMKWVLGFFGFAFADLANPDCIGAGGYRPAEEWFFKSLFPLAFLLPFVVKLLVLDRWAFFSREKTIQTLVLLLTITYIYAISTAMEVWDCRPYNDGKMRLDSSVSSPVNT